jgi:hypothetical protein
VSFFYLCKPLVILCLLLTGVPCEIPPAFGKLAENLAQMAASKFIILDVAIQFKLGRVQPTESMADLDSVAKFLVCCI